MIKDSGDRTKFETGAVRDIHEGKGRMDLLPWAGIMEVSKHCEEGAKKYGEHNIDKGMPQHTLVDSGARHLAKYIDGQHDEDHLRAAAWNILWALDQTVNHPELIDIAGRTDDKDSVKARETPLVAYAVFPNQCSAVCNADEVRQRIERYGFISIRDYYNIVGIDYKMLGYTDHQLDDYGWTSKDAFAFTPDIIVRWAQNTINGESVVWRLSPRIDDGYLCTRYSAMDSINAAKKHREMAQNVYGGELPLHGTGKSGRYPWGTSLDYQTGLIYYANCVKPNPRCKPVILLKDSETRGEAANAMYRVACLCKKEGFISLRTYYALVGINCNPGNKVFDVWGWKDPTVFLNSKDITFVTDTPMGMPQWRFGPSAEPVIVKDMDLRDTYYSIKDSKLQTWFGDDGEEDDE